MAAPKTVTKVGSSVSGRCPSCGVSALRVHGYARGATPEKREALNCQRPLLVACDACTVTPWLWRCASHRQSACKPCAARYRRRVKRIAESGLKAWGEVPGYLYLATVTAPGEGKAHCKKKGCPHEGNGAGCSHRRCDCTPLGGVVLADWNASHSKRWNRLRTRLRQVHPGLVYMRGVEAQDGKHRLDGKGRAALHDHAVVYSPTRLSLAELRRLAVKAGFGHEVDLAPLTPGSRKAAYYVAKYVGKSTDVRAQVPWSRWKRVAPDTSAAGAAHEGGGLRWDHAVVATRPALEALGDLVAEEITPPEAVWSPEEGCYVVLLDDDGDDWRAWTPVRQSDKATYRTWSMSRDWGMTMAEVKAEASAYALLKADVPEPPACVAPEVPRQPAGTALSPPG